MRRRFFSGANCIIRKEIRRVTSGERKIMDKFKRFAAIAGVALLLIIFCGPMFFALSGSENAWIFFRASLGAALLVPIMLYIFMAAFGIWGKKKPQKKEGQMIENIIFDIGKVLMAFEWEKYLESFGFSKEKYERIADATFRTKVWDERDRGLFEEEEYIRQFITLAPEYEEDIKEVLRRSPETISLFPYAETWVKYLKEQGYHLYILSNYSSYMLEHTKDQMKFLKYMDGAIFSCKVKELKPEDGIYKKLLGTYSLDPSKSIFLDDREENCKGAEKQGIHSIVFKDFKQAVSELEKYGVK